MSDPEPMGFAARLVSAQKRQTRELLGELVRMRGLMPLLMRHRNGGTWSPEEKRELLIQLRILSHVSPYLLLLLLPGSALLLPVYAWWLDHRRTSRTAVDGLRVSAALLESTASGEASQTVFQDRRVSE